MFSIPAQHSLMYIHWTKEQSKVDVATVEIMLNVNGLRTPLSATDGTTGQKVSRNIKDLNNIISQ